MVVVTDVVGTCDVVVATEGPAPGLIRLPIESSPDVVLVFIIVAGVVSAGDIVVVDCEVVGRRDDVVVPWNLLKPPNEVAGRPFISSTRLPPDGVVDCLNLVIIGVVAIVGAGVDGGDSVCV